MTRLLQGKIYGFLVTLFLAFSVSPLYASFKINDIEYEIISQDDATVKIIAVQNKRNKVIIPSIVYDNGKEYTVTEIGNKAFYFTAFITEIYLPNTITKIGNGAFQMSGAQTISIPNSVKKIGNEAFRNCSSLTTITLPEGLERIGILTFDGCERLNTINVPNSVTSFGTAAFRGCSSLSSINIPEGIKVIESGTFWGCSSLENVTIPNSVTSIEGNAFEDCNSLESINLPNNLKEIGDDAFKSCYLLTSIIIPNSVKKIGYYAFAFCKQLRNLTLPAGIHDFGTSILFNCNSIEELTISENYSCINEIDHLILNKDFKYQPYYNGVMISYCYLSQYNAKRITILSPTPPIIQDRFSETDKENIELTVPTEALEAYKKADTWKDFTHLKGGAESITGIKNTKYISTHKTTYYNLEGSKVTSPEKGKLYIVKTGNIIRKIIY